MGSEYDYDKHFRALCALRKQQSVPLGMLQKLWDLGSLKETEEVAENMDELSLVEMREVNRVVFIQLHDLVLDLAKYKASRKCETQSFSRRLIDNYIRYSKRSSLSTLEVHEDGIVAGKIGEEQVEAETGSENVSPGMVEVTKDAAIAHICGQQMFRYAWWSSEDDGYLHNNICRLLRNAGYTGELLWLLSQPQWIVSRLLKGGIYNVEQDLEEGKAVIANNGAFESEHKEHLEMIGKAARLGCTFVNENSREVWFQVHGRLFQHARVNERTSEFVEKMEQLAPRPWVKASIGILQQASRAVHDVITGKGRVVCARVEQDHVWFVWKGGNKMGVSRYNTSTGSHRHVDFAVDRILEDGRLPGVKCATFIGDESSVASAHKNEKVYVWSRETGELNADVTRNGRRRSGNVKPCLRQRQKFLHCFGSCGIERKSCEDECGRRFVAFSADGTLVATECDHHTIRMWNTLNGEAVGPPLRGHDCRVRSLAMSADGRRIVSRSVDGTVRLWEAESGEAVRRPLRGHTMSVICVAVNADGSCIVSGSDDKRGRVWKAESGFALREPLRGHTGWVTCVALSADGTRIVTGSDDSTVRVWEVESGNAVGQPLRGHSKPVSLCGSPCHQQVPPPPTVIQRSFLVLCARTRAIAQLRPLHIYSKAPPPPSDHVQRPTGLASQRRQGWGAGVTGGGIGREKLPARVSASALERAGDVEAAPCFTTLRANGAGSRSRAAFAWGVCGSRAMAAARSWCALERGVAGAIHCDKFQLYAVDVAQCSTLPSWKGAKEQLGRDPSAAASLKPPGHAAALCLTVRLLHPSRSDQSWLKVLNC